MAKDLTYNKKKITDSEDEYSDNSHKKTSTRRTKQASKRQIEDALDEYYEGQE